MGESQPQPCAFDFLHSKNIAETAKTIKKQIKYFIGSSLILLTKKHAESLLLKKTIKSHFK